MELTEGRLYLKKRPSFTGGKFYYDSNKIYKLYTYNKEK